MAIKTFTTGEVLTASDTNTYLANSGLVYVTSGALSSTATNFVGCFSSTYTNYLITLDNLEMNATGDIYLRMLSGSTAITAADYFWAFVGLNDAGGAVNSNGASQTLGFTGFSQASANNLAIGSSRIDVFAPFLAKRTFFKCASVAFPSGSTATRDGANRHNLTTSYDGIQFLSAAATTMGGTVTIYGYRKA
jgi:hypothetical protein